MDAHPSPFVGSTKIQHAWDSTSLGWLKECPRKYQYHMLEGWVSKAESVHLKFGIIYHEALEAYEKYRADTGSQHNEAVNFTVHELLKRTWEDGKPWRAREDLPADDPVSMKCREYLVRTVVWYLEKFKDDPCRTRQHPGTGRPMLELHFQFEVGFNHNFGQPYSLCGHLDRIVDFQDQPFIMERKTTTGTLGTYYFDQYDPDNQVSLYTVASNVSFHTPVKGVIIDAAQIAVGFSRFVRSFVFKAPDQLDEWMMDLRFWLMQAEFYVERNYWPQNDKSCHKYGGCVFRGICSKSPSVRDKFLESNFTKREWNPLIPR